MVQSVDCKNGNGEFSIQRWKVIVASNKIANKDCLVPLGNINSHKVPVHTSSVIAGHDKLTIYKTWGR